MGTVITNWLTHKLHFLSCLTLFNVPNFVFDNKHLVDLIFHHTRTYVQLVCTLYIVLSIIFTYRCRPTYSTAGRMNISIRTL